MLRNKKNKCHGEERDVKWAYIWISLKHFIRWHLSFAVWTVVDDYIRHIGELAWVITILKTLTRSQVEGVNLGSRVRLKFALCTIIVSWNPKSSAGNSPDRLYNDWLFIIFVWFLFHVFVLFSCFCSSHLSRTFFELRAPLKMVYCINMMTRSGQNHSAIWGVQSRSLGPLTIHRLIFQFQ